MKFYSIAGKILAIQSELPYYYSNLEDFSVDTSIANLTITLDYNTTIIEPNTEPIIHSSYLVVYKENHTYQLFYPEQNFILGASYNCATQTGTIYISDNKNQESTIPNLTLDDYIFFSIRDLFLIFMQQEQMLAIHSSSIIYKDKAYLFSACSGTGKTTHTNMWVNTYGVEILDGDITAITIEDNIAYAYGLPWCGTSNRYLNKKVPLGAVIFLQQSCHNIVTTLTPFESILRLTARCFTPTWTKEQAQINLDLSERFIKLIPCFFLGCLPNEDAMNLVKEKIDNL